MWTLALEDDGVLKIVGLGVGGVIAIVWIVFASVRKMVVGRAQEASRREIAAYVAEGSMTPEQGEKLLKAGCEDGSCGKD